MYKRRRAVIEIDMVNLIDYYHASDIGDVLKSLPEGTDIISFGCSPDRAILTIIVENDHFKEVEPSEYLPVIPIKKDMLDYNYRVDCSAIMEQVEEKKKQQPHDPTSVKTIMSGITASNYDAWKSFPFKFNFPTYDTIRTVQETAFSKNNGMLEFATIEKMVSEPRPVTAPSIELPFPKGTRLTTTCTHAWKPYEGLTEKYEFCEICNERKA